MDPDLRRLLVVVAAVVACVAAVAGWWTVRGARAPRLLGVQVVYRADGEARASDRERVLPAGAKVEAAAVVAFRRGDRGPVRHLCAFPAVEVDGVEVPVEPVAAWPSSGGVLRAHWFTVEPAYLGWTAVAAGEAHRLVYKDFFAPELGRDLRVDVRWEAHNDDFFGARPEGHSLPGGPVRLKARVSAYRTPDDLVPAQFAFSPGAAEIMVTNVPAAIRAIPLPAGVDPGVARYLRLGCFTFAAGVWPDGGAGWALPITPRLLVERGLLTTPRALAAAAAGTPLGDPWASSIPVEPGAGGRWGSAGSALRWGAEVRAGDAVRVGERYLALVSDDGDGVLSDPDSVLLAWREPARFDALGLAATPLEEPVQLLRVER